MVFVLQTPAQEVVEGRVVAQLFWSPRKSQRTKKTCDSGTQPEDLCDIHLDHYKNDFWDGIDCWRVAEAVIFFGQPCMRTD